MFSFWDCNFISGKIKSRCVKCRRTEGQRGKLETKLANIARNLWGCDLLQQWNIQINIPPITETNHKLTNVSETNIKKHYEEQSLTIQVVHKQGTKKMLTFQSYQHPYL